ncbi:hydroxyacylglutathione hydrolase [Gemmobacter tilapiae]|uniref:Hydroxyacylglutathione hydrolase n=2 Tax=Neogemmobacter tilapiae TaxID=875041 RepID=A0A918WHQ1_9RHOB|nr:hydroxyacylglutathione hydrolase [Gemmobacter tilapiae]
MEMALELVTIPCLSDNYAFLVHDVASGATALIDVPEAGPILAVLKEKGWTLDQIWLTHHHDDHIQGVPDMVVTTGAKVLGAKADAHRLPPLDLVVEPGQSFDFAGEPVEIIDVPGHTVGHIALYLPKSGYAFTADSLMAMGCGRLFEGTPAQMWDTMQRLSALPPETVICSGHEYTTGNARFAASLEPENPALILRVAAIAAAREKGQPTVPSLLSDELATNPFLRAHLPALKAAVGMEGASDVDVFAEIRTRKNNF